MLPLVLFPGAGSEIYRGLGSVVVGGLSLSAILTLAIVPPLLSIVMQTVETARAERLANKQKTLINEAQVIEVSVILAA